MYFGCPKPTIARSLAGLKPACFVDEFFVCLARTRKSKIGLQAKWRNCSLVTRFLLKITDWFWFSVSDKGQCYLFLLTDNYCCFERILFDNFQVSESRLLFAPALRDFADRGFYSLYSFSCSLVGLQLLTLEMASPDVVKKIEEGYAKLQVRYMTVSCTT